MIVGVGNNIISALAADISVTDTSIPILPGDGALFAKLLTYDYVNSSNQLAAYGKITLMDSGQTEVEICHVTAVSGDTLTVVRGQEGTTPRGWFLNDAVGNLPTRGTMNQIVQIEQLQSGHYTSAIAGGTANTLTADIPATYFVNGATDWSLRTPLIIYPTMNNTGASTLQLVMGGRVLGTYPLYKGNQQQLEAGDIIANVGIICVMDGSGTFFFVLNPVLSYGNFVKRSGDTMTGPLTINTDNEAISIVTIDPNNASYIRSLNGTSVGWYVGKGSVDDNGVGLGNYTGSNSFLLSGDGSIYLLPAPEMPINLNGDTAVVGKIFENEERVYSPNNPQPLPTPAQIGAYPATGGVLNGDMQATGSVLDGGQRVYSPNNPPPALFSSALNTISWEKNLETGVIRQWGFVNVTDNSYITVNLPLAFPASFLSLSVTTQIPGAVSSNDVVSSFGQIQTNSSFGVGISSNFSLNLSGVYFEAIGV